MGFIKQIINWLDSGLNFDGDARVLGVGDSTDRVNVTTNELGREFVISNMKGTVKKSHTFTHHADYHAAVYKVIGSCYDDNRDSVYLFIHSTDDNHSILRFNFSDDSFDKIAWDHTGLGLDPDYPITDAYMIGDFLHWNPRTSSPRVINVVWAYWDFVAYDRALSFDGVDWSVGDYATDRNRVYKILVAGIGRSNSLRTMSDTDVEFTDWTYQDVDTYPPSGTYGEYVRYRDFYNTPIKPFTEVPYTNLTDDTDVNANYIRGNIFQFTYRFYVPGQGYTTAGTFSTIIANENDESFDGEIIESITTNNVIDVGINVGDNGSNNLLTTGKWLWEFVDILFRRNDDLTWRLADRIYSNDSGALRALTISAGVTSYVVSTLFYNDRAYEVVDSAAIEKPYNALPKTARAQWALDGERSAYGGVTEGFDYPATPIVTMEAGNRPVEVGNITYPAEDDTVDFTGVITEDDEGVLFTFTSDAISALPAAGASPWDIRFYFFNKTYSGSYTGASASAYRAAVLSVVNLAGVSAIDNGSDQIVFSSRNTSPTPVVTLFGTGTISSANAITKVSSFKSNAEHPFCLFYYDDPHRRSDPITQVNVGTQGTMAFIPSLPDEGVLTVGTNHQQYIDWTISHPAPSWAKYWRWGYAGNNSISLFWQYNINGIAAGADGLAGYALVDISGLQTITNEDSGNSIVHINSNISSYVFEPGDRLRFITQHDGGATSTTDLVLADSGYDYEIKGFDDINHLVHIDVAAADGDPYADYDGDETVIEIYRPKRERENLEYYEYGPLYDVYESSGEYFHRGPAEDQSTGVSAKGTHTLGDVTLMTRQVANGPFASASDPIFMESYHWSDFYDSDQWGRGRIGIISGIGEKYMDNVRFSNKYSPNTLSSGLSEFDFLDYKSLSSETGKITAMRQAGHVLKVYFERNSASVMVNKTQYTDADGISQVVKSDLVLGSVEYSNYHYGTIFPESVLLIDRTIYFYDIYRKAYVRDASNGMFPISKYKANKKIVDISEALLTSGVSNVQVWSAYDFERDFLYVMFYDSVDSDNDDVLIFNEKRKRWETRVKMKENIQIGAYVRNEELDYRLTSSVETGIVVAAINTGTDRITFTNLPTAFETVLQNPTANEEWLCVNLDTFSAGGYTLSGDYENSLLITGYNSDDEEYTYTVEHGADTNWTALDQVVFINPFRFISYYNSGDGMIDYTDITIGQSLLYTQNGPMFRRTDGTFVLLTNSQTNPKGARFYVVPFTSTDPDTTWTSTDSVLFDPTDFDAGNVNVFPSGNPVWLEDEDKWLFPVSEYTGSVYSIGLYKCDEDFSNETFYHSVVTDSVDYATGAYYPSMVLFEGEYYIFYTARGASPDTSTWDFRVIKSSNYANFSGSTAKTITTNTLLADGATGANQEKWYNSHIDSNTSFIWEDRLYILVSGTSRYDISGNRSNRINGLFEYNPSTGLADVSRVGVVYPNLLDGAWPNSYWGRDHIGTSITWVQDPVNDVYISSFCQEPGADSYEVGLGNFDFDLLFAESDAVGFALPAAIGTTAQDLISFIGEDLYVHNNNESRGFFYNSLKKMVLNVIVNQNADVTKVLDSITLNTNDGEWEITNIVIPPTPNYPRGMTSKIPNVFFEKRENGIHSEFLRNMKTSSNTESTLELREGDELRGQTATITLENAESGEVVLFDILVNMSDSKI